MKDQALAARCRSLRLVLTDVDGVMTDGTILLLPDGGEGVQAEEIVGRRPEPGAVPQVAAPQRGRPRPAGEDAGDAGEQDGEERRFRHERRPVTPRGW